MSTGMALAATLLLGSCSLSHHIRHAAERQLLSDTTLGHAHLGVAVFDPEAGQWLYRFQSDKYFVPASNTKIITCFAAMKHLGDSLDGIVWRELDTAILLEPTGDPTLLHPDFRQQPVMDRLAGNPKPVYLNLSSWKTTPWGSGWSWDDYDAYYMAERSPFPVHGNYVTWQQSISKKERPASPGDTLDVFVTSDPEGPWQVAYKAPDPTGRFSVGRERDQNRFWLTEGRTDGAHTEVPFVTHTAATAIEVLQERLSRPAMAEWPQGIPMPTVMGDVVRSVPTDSLLRPLMHRSDNFFAEQALLMISRKLTGVFRESAAIDTLLATTLLGMPQLPRWADGSGLSRYNLFTPEDFIWVLGQMRAAFPMARIQTLLPTAGTGTLGSMDRRLSGHIHAKTGTLTGVVALSGYLRTKKGRWLLFSLLVNHHRGTAAGVRKRYEAFLLDLYERG